MIVRRKRSQEQINEYHTNLYLISFSAILARTLLDYSQLQNGGALISLIKAALMGIFFAGMMYKLCIQSYNLVTLVVTVGWGIAMLITYAKAPYFILLCSYFSVVSAQHVDFKKVITAVYRTKIAYMVFHLVIYIIVYFVRNDLISYSYRVAGEPRHFFFMGGHANTFSAIMTWTVFEYLYVNHENLNWKKIVGAWLIIFGFYQFTDSNTSMIVGSVVTVLLLVKGNMKWLERIITFFSKYAFLFFSIFFPYLAVVYTQLSGKTFELWHALNLALTGRLLYGACAYDLAGWTLFGQLYHFGELTYWNGFWINTIIFDNAYLYMFLQQGYIHLFVIGIAFFLMSKTNRRQDKIFIIAFILYGVMESYITSVVFCFPYMIIGRFLFTTGKKTENDVIAKQEATSDKG